MVEEIITGLSRIKWLFVIARNSSFAYKGKSPDIRQVGRELGVRYVLEGSVRKAGNRVRVTGQLIEAEAGAHVWADKFDGASEDIFDLQDKITDAVVGIIEPSVQRGEIERVGVNGQRAWLRSLSSCTAVLPVDHACRCQYRKNLLNRRSSWIRAMPGRHMAWAMEIRFLRGGLTR
jgi:hypothetical protein